MDWDQKEVDALEDCYQPYSSSIANLKAIATRAVELYRARLAPTGQVAEDAKRLLWVISETRWASAAHRELADAALSRLAAGAQAREQAERERDEARREERAAMEGWDEAQKERDAARQERDESRESMRRLRSETQELADIRDRLERERDTARQEIESLRAQLDGARQNESRALEQGGRDQEEIDRLRAQVARLQACNDAMRESMRLLRELVDMPAQGEATVVNAVLARVAEVERERGKTLLLLGDWQQATRCSTPQIASALLEQHAKALVRAKNAGREEAARLAESIGANAEDDIRAMKEPES